MFCPSFIQHNKYNNKRAMEKDNWTTAQSYMCLFKRDTVAPSKGTSGIYRNRGLNLDYNLSMVTQK